MDNPPTDHDNSSKGKKRSHSTESPSHDTRSSTAKDDSSTGKKKTNDVSKSDRTYSASDDGGDPEDKSSSNSVTSLSSHTNDGKASSSDLASAIRNKVNSIIRNILDKVGHNFFGFSDNGGF